MHVRSLGTRTVRSGKRAAAMGIGVALLAFVPISAAHADGPNVPNPNFGIGGFTAGVSPTAIVDGDFNQDGQADIAVANSSSGDVTIETSADGHQFSQAATNYVGGSPFAITTADFNGDHDPDLVIANSALGSVQILLGEVGANFAAPISIPTAFFPSTVAVADLNADSRPDLIVGTQTSDGGVFTFRGLGGTAFANPTKVPLDGVQSVVVADFNGDHDPDVAAATTDDRIAVMLGAPGTTLGTPTYVTGIGPGPRHMLAVGNFNADTDPDLAVVNGGNEDIQGNVSVLLGGPGKTFAPPVQYAAGAGYVPGIAIGDLDNDGIQDLVITNYALDKVTLLFGDGAGKFAAPFLVPEGGTGPVAVVVTNFDDNLPDLAVANNQSNDVSILINFGPGRHADSPASDLVVRGISQTPANPGPGDAVTFKALVTNEGDIATPAGVVVGVSFEVDGTQVTWSANSTKSIPAGGAVTLTASGGPHGPAWIATPGQHVVRATVDDQRRIFELDELNNSLTVSLRVRQADLTVTKVTWTPANPVAGTPVKFIAAVKNLGDAPTPSGTIVEVQFIVDAQIVNTSTYFSSSIPAGTTVYLGATNGPHGPTWTATSGTHFVRAYVDAPNRIAESNEGNNGTILDADLVVP